MRSRLPRPVRGELGLLLGLVLLLVAVTVLVRPPLADRRDEPRRPRLSIHSKQAEGARALSLWLAELGYQVASIEYRPFAVDPEVRLLFVLLPTRDLVEAQVVEIARWVEAGGTLVLAVDRANGLLQRLGVELVRRDGVLDQAVPRQPVFQTPPFGQVEVKTPTRVQFHRSEWVPVLGASELDGDVVAGVGTFGKGRVFVLAAEHPLTNAGLGRADHWALALHFLAGVPAGATVAFDEYHHGLTEHGTLGALLVREPWGWAILYSAGLLFVYVALRGRRFGRPMLPPAVGTRRSRGEYVATLAALLRQGGHREWLRQQYVVQLKRTLGARYGIRADLPGSDFAAALAARRPEAAALAGPLGQLERPAGDAMVVSLMLEVDRVRARLDNSAGR